MFIVPEVLAGTDVPKTEDLGTRRSTSARISLCLQRLLTKF